jgi:hypothetical protein
MKLAHLLFAAVGIAAVIGFAVDGNERASAAPAAAPEVPVSETTAHVLPPGHPSIASTGAAASVVPVKDVAPASGENAKRIADIYREQEALAGERVRVRGVVVKTTSGIKGLSYSHLQDGSGKAESGDHDLTVTTRAELQKGSIVTLEGALERDVELGAGYRYDVLLSNAEVVGE